MNVDHDGVAIDKKRKLTMNLSMLDGILLALFLINSTGPLATAYALRLGAREWLIGFLVCIPLLAQFAGVFTPWIAGFFGKRKLLAVLTALIGRGIWLFGVFAPQLFSSTPEVGWFILFTGIASIFLSINTNIWYEWITCTVPNAQCAPFFSLRNGITTFAGTGLNVALGYWLDSIGTPLWALQAGLSLCAVLALIGALVLCFYYEPAKILPKISLTKSILAPFADKDLKKTLNYSFWANSSIFMLLPITYSYLIKEIQFGFTQISIWLGITAMILLIFSALWRKTVSKAGSKPTLVLSTILLGAVLPLLYISSTTHSVIPAYIAAGFEALVLGVVNPALFQLVMRKSSGEHRFSYVTLYLTVAGVGGSLGALSFGPLYNFLEQFKFIFLGIDFNGYRLMFALAGVVRLLSLGLLRFIDEPPNSFGLEPLTTKQTVLLFARESVDTFKQNAFTVKQTVKYILTSVFKRRKSDLNE